MRRSLLIGLTLFLLGASPTLAFYDPLKIPNNRVGVHVLEPGEVAEAAKLVNSHGGQWGYVTVVIRSNDLDREKWIKFFEECRKLQVIPIVRLATYPDGGTWVKPDALDLVDFANFLSDMPWPVENRYIILFNEVNHAGEWGDVIDPLEYSTLLLDAKRIFKARSSDYFLLSAGLDMSSPQAKDSWDALNYYRQLSRLQPDWYNSVDGLAVHSYPNPAFSASPTSTGRYGISGYKFETQLLRSLGYPDKPIFITETGWPHEQPFFKTAFTQVWTDPQIVAITPFLLFAGSGDFARFSLLSPNHDPKITYQEIADLDKIPGSPLLSETTIVPAQAYTSNIDFIGPAKNIWEKVSTLWAKVLGLKRMAINDTVFNIEIADTELKQQQGLSGRSQLADLSGMLFVFSKPDKHQFWMKDMNFALDFIWIRGGKVVQINTNVLPPSQTQDHPQIVDAEVKIDQVLEVAAGTVDKYGIKVGDIVERR